MEINELKNIIPLKYNSFYSVHKSKKASGKNFKNLPSIKTFSRNFNNELKKIHFTLTQENNKNNNLINSNSICDKTGLMSGKGKMPKSNYFRLTNYIKNKYSKNITKIKNKVPSQNKVKEIQLNLNKTEYNKFNNKYFNIDIINREKSKTQNKFMQNKYKLIVDDIYKFQKTEFKNAINSENKRNIFINNYSSIIYYQIFPKRMRNNFPLNEKIPNFFNHYILKKSSNYFSKKQPNELIKDNYFIEMIIENVTRKVEYNNQKNERITIGLVKNLLDEEIDSITNKLNFLFNQDLTKYNNESKINKSTSTNEFNNLKFLNQTYENFSHRKNNLEMNIEEKIKKKIEKKVLELNEKYGFMNGSDNVLMNMRMVFDESYNADRNYKYENENDLKIKSRRKKRFNDDEEDNNLGNFIWNMANNIDNLEEYKKKNFEQEKDYIFQNTKIKGVFEKYLFIKDNHKNSKKREFTMNNFSIKKNIDFNDIQSNIKQLYNQYNLKKESEEKKILIESKTQSPAKRKKIEENIYNNTSPNILKNEREKEKVNKPRINNRLSTNMRIENILSIINDNQQYDQLINRFGGYYTENQDKEIIKKIKDSNPNINNIAKIYNEVETKIMKEKKFDRNFKKILYYSPKKVPSNKESKQNYNNLPKYNNFESIDNDYIDNINDGITHNEYNKGNSDNNYRFYNKVENKLNNHYNKYSDEENDSNNDYIIEEKKKGKNKKIKNKKTNNIEESKQEKDKIRRKNRNKAIGKEDVEILKEKSSKEGKEKLYIQKNSEQEKEQIRSNKGSYMKNKAKNDDNLKEEGNDSEIRNKKSKFNITHAKINNNLNDLEKDFIIKTNFLSDLEEKDKEQLLKYFEELEELSERLTNFSSNNFIRDKINNIHYQIKNFIISLFQKFNKNKEDYKEKEAERKGKSTFFNTIRNKQFLEKQKKILELKEELEEEEEEQNILQVFAKKLKNKKRNNFDFFDAELEILFEKERKRSRSFNIKMLRSYPKLYHNLLFNVLKGKENESRAHTPKKDLQEDEWEKYLLKTSIKRSNKFDVKISKFVKRKKKANKNAKKSLFVDEYKNTKNIKNILKRKEEEDEEIENLKDEIKRNKLKKELMEKKLYDFFNKIQTLKKGGNDSNEKELEILIDEQLDKMDYTKKKENESRVNNFMQEFDLNRTKNVFSKKYHSKRIHFLSPVSFFTKQNQGNKNIKDLAINVF